jgi:hypothetical protein
MAVIVVYAGGFQPFHQGHLSSYIQAKEAFPNADFYVAASADVKQRPIPYEVKKFLAVQAGVQPKDFPNIVVASPLSPKEILSKYNPDQDIFILVRSERDPVGYTKKDGSPGYYQPFVKGKKVEPFAKHGYVFVTKKHDFVINGQEVYSGTQVRDMYKNADDAGRQQIIAQLYPKSKQQPKIKEYLDQYIGSEITPPKEEPKLRKTAMKKLQSNPLKESLRDLIKTTRPLLKEANAEQKLKLLRLIREAFNKVNEQVAAEGSDELYQKAIRKYAQRVANDYLGGGNEYLYGANKFDSEMFGVDPKQAQQDFKTLFPQYLKKLQGVAEDYLDEK